MAKILIVEDDPQLADLIVQCLSRENHLVEHVDNGADALSQVKLYIFDLIILDWNLPEVSGLGILQEFRARGGVTPVLFLTGRRDLADKLEGLDAGADDYLTKPFDSRELKSRVRALLRRPTALVG
ncbi:MAG: response regulator, partial [Candidatus Obscuribacterales bacterium]